VGRGSWVVGRGPWVVDRGSWTHPVSFRPQTWATAYKIVDSSRRLFAVRTIQSPAGYLGTVPAKKRVSRICKAISNETGRNRTLLDHQTVVTKLNQMMNGWANYFCLGPVSKAYEAIDRHACKRLRQWLCAKHKVARPATRKYSEKILHDTFGLVRLKNRTHSFSWAKS